LNFCFWRHRLSSIILLFIPCSRPSNCAIANATATRTTPGRMARGPIIIAFELHVYQWTSYVPHFFEGKRKYSNSISGFLQWPDEVHTAVKLQALCSFL
jgi:hypothetical protein